jgi:hypothetical protein
VGRAEALLGRRPGNRQRVDRIRPARLPKAALSGGHQLRRHAHDPLAAGRQEPLELAHRFWQSSIAQTRSQSGPRARPSEIRDPFLDVRRPTKLLDQYARSSNLLNDRISLPSDSRTYIGVAGWPAWIRL